MHVTHGRGAESPFFSICIPQYNRTEFLIAALQTLQEQSFRDFEICISDDCSNDGKEQALIDALHRTGMPFVYRKQERNARYDGNLRAAIDMSRGQYCYLLGNDDGLASPDELAQLHGDIAQVGEVGVVISNFREVPTGKVVRRMPRSGVVGAGPSVAAINFRNFSFVSGVVLHGPRARALSTARWDGSEMYQMYLGCAIIAEGRPLLGLERVGVDKDLQIPGQAVDTYARRPRLDPCPIVERKHTFHFLSHLVFAAIEPALRDEEKAPMLEYVTAQVLIFIYPFWVIEYRRVQSWNYAAGICLGMRPRNLLPDDVLGQLSRARVGALYGAMTVAGLVVPVGVFARAKPALHRLSKQGLGMTALRSMIERLQ